MRVSNRYSFAQNVMLYNGAHIRASDCFSGEQKKNTTTAQKIGCERGVGAAA